MVRTEFWCRQGTRTSLLAPSHGFVPIQGSRIGDYRVRDLSAGGAFVTGGSVPPVGAPVDVLIKADQFGVISLRADVVRCATHADGAGVGLRFRPAPTHIEDMIVDAVLGELRKARRVVAA